MSNIGLHNLSPVAGAVKSRRRVGRGKGSGRGKTCGRGHKGKKARTHGVVAPGFEGGQTPLFRILPKRGFVNPFRKEYTAVNLRDLGKMNPKTIVNVSTLRQAGILKSGDRRFVLLGSGVVHVPYTVEAHRISAAAKQAVEKAGGSVTVIPEEASLGSH